MSEFNPARLILARQRRALSAQELAMQCNVTPQTLSNWESGRTTPAPEILERLATEIGVPVRFFFKGDPPSLPMGEASFRARSRLGARQRDAALAAGALAAELLAWIEDRFELPAVGVPDLSGQPPLAAAEALRSEWALGDRPITNMITLLESRGVMVFSLAQDCLDIDAFSFWSHGRPVVLLNMLKSAERSRLDAAHELAHLALHREETGKKEEEEANEFAGALLMPMGDIYRHLPRVVSIPHLIAAKRRWGVSLAALAYRLHALRIASEWKYRTLFVELSRRGYRTEEPDPIPRERSSLLHNVFSYLASQGTTPRALANELAWNPGQLNELIFGMGATLLGVEGGRGLH